MKIVTIVGARPQFIKAAAVSRVLRKKNEEIIVHTGQHYDDNMSEVFFRELQIPYPNYNLNVGSGTHANQTAEMLKGIEEILLSEKPEYILVYGDTNSTLAGALAAVKIHIPIIHIEAGLRSFNMNMPEEVNRILTDRISKLLFCPTETAVTNLHKEGIQDFVYNVGDVMCDAVIHYTKETDKLGNEFYFSKLISLDGKTIRPVDKWYLATIHRAENTDNIAKIRGIMSALNELDVPVIFPVHPRTRKFVTDIQKENNFDNIFCVEPIGYIDMLFFAKNAVKVVTDSGGLQKEAYILHTPCVTVRDQTEWVETLVGNHNILAKPDRSDILSKVNNTIIDENIYSDYYGIGNAAEKICNIIDKYGKV